MSHETISCMSSPASVVEVESVVSDIESTFSLGDNTSTACIDKESSRPTAENKLGGHTGMSAQSTGHSLFRSGDGNIFLLVNDTVLETHKHVLRKFNKLDSMITDESTHIPLSLRRDERGVEDFQHTFKILYASMVEGPFEFDSLTLTSALRIATAYDYPGLRSFAIEKLENASLSAVERIRLAREFDLALWEAPAFAELCERDEAITRAEAAVLGFDTFVDLAEIREKEQRRRGREIDVARRGEFDAAEEQRDSMAPTGSSHLTSQIPAAADSKLESNTGEHSPSHEAKSDVSEESNGEMMKPRFVNAAIPNSYPNHLKNRKTETIQVIVSDCDCKCDRETKDSATYTCKLPPCAVAAFKHLQAQQLAHSDHIAKLDTSVEQLKSLPTPTHAFGSRFGDFSGGRGGFRGFGFGPRRFGNECVVEQAT